MARFKKNSKGFYRTGVTIGYSEDGRLVRKYVTGKTIAELEAKIAEVKAAVGSGRNLLDENVRFGDYARMWLDTYKAGRGINTRTMYSNIIGKKLVPLYGLKVKDVKAMHLQSLINDNSALPRTCEQMRMTLRQIFKQAIEDGLITRNPATAIELPRHIRNEKRALTEEEKAAVKAADLTERERAFIMIAMGCGLRPGEIYALTWEDIDFKNEIISVNKSLVFNHNQPVLSVPKTNKSIRLVDAPQAVMKALKVYRSTNIAPKLFGGKYDDYKGKTGYVGEWERIKKKIEAALGHETDLTLYCFRHNYCSELYYSEISMKEAQRLLGHSSYKMIMDVYAHLDAQKENTKKKLNAIDF
ncbi:MAG: site-specific integrase [Lachnospiraceae bacterium]|nr:site-specific integrase [Lachnospiraceae bacterium]